MRQIENSYNVPDNSRTFQKNDLTNVTKEVLRRNNESYKFKFNRQILNIVKLGFCNIIPFSVLIANSCKLNENNCKLIEIVAN